MYISDVSAIDRLIDIYGQYLIVKYNDYKYELEELRDYFVDHNLNCSVDLHTITKDGIMDKSFNYIIEVTDLNDYHKDDLIKI